MTTHEERIARLEESMRLIARLDPNLAAVGEPGRYEKHADSLRKLSKHNADAARAQIDNAAVSELSVGALERARLAVNDWDEERSPCLSESSQGRLCVVVAKAIDAAVAEERKRLPTWDAYHRMDEERDALRAELEEERAMRRMAEKLGRVARAEADRYGSDFCDKLQQDIDERNVTISGLRAELDATKKERDKWKDAYSLEAQRGNGSYGLAVETEKLRAKLDRLVRAVDAWRESSRNPEAWGALNDALNEARA